MIDMDCNITETEEHWLVEVNFKVNLKNILIFLQRDKIIQISNMVSLSPSLL
jgi:hypothetical protein